MMRLPGILSISLCLAAPHTLADVSHSGDSTSLLSGMILRDAMFILSPHKLDQRTLIRAKEALIKPTTNLLELVGMHMTTRRGSESHVMDAARAFCDLQKSTIRTEGACAVHSKGLSIRGESFEGNPSTLSFRTTRPVEVSSGTTHTPYPIATPARRTSYASPWTFALPAPPNYLHAHEPPPPLRLVQKFSGDLATFARCWHWVKSTTWPDPPRVVGPLAMNGPHGGTFDLSRHELEFAGPSAILAPNAVLISTNGLHLYRETSDHENILRLSAAGGVTGWMKSATKEYTVRANHMDFAGDLPILQFEGGPVRFQNGNVILQATEEWQFLRVMENGRIVISPGSWTTLTAQEG